jgi:transcriptional regulator with XRE-family HTH domain
MDLGLRQRDLAERLGVREETVTNWEKGQLKPRIRYWSGILAFLGHDPDPQPDTLAGRLRKIRRRFGLTQEELAGRLLLDEKQICQWEAGRSQPHRWIFGRIDRALRALEGREAASREEPGSYCDLTRWRRTPVAAGISTPRTRGERLRARRLRLGLSQVEVAGRVGISRGTLHRIERDRLRVTDKLIARLEAALGNGSGGGGANAANGGGAMRNETGDGLAETSSRCRPTPRRGRRTPVIG